MRALASGVSRGTELLVHRGEVPEAVRDLMRAPFQQGQWPGPVKYGYLSVGEVEAVGDPSDQGWVGARTFCLHPHQDRYTVPLEALTVLPDDVPTERAVLLGTMETAVNALWDAQPAYGDRVAVVGAGMVGACVTALLGRMPLQRLELVDPDPERAAVATGLGARGVSPGQAGGDCDVVIHCSATQGGLQQAIDLLGPEATVVEMSWFGDRPVTLDLGGAFHARRGRIIVSQVGTLSPVRSARRDHRSRMALAAAALSDPALDGLLAGPRPFTELPALMDELAADAPGLCHVVHYDDPTPQP